MVVAQCLDDAVVIVVVLVKERKHLQCCLVHLGKKKVCVGKNLILYKIFYHDYYYLGNYAK